MPAYPAPPPGSTTRPPGAAEAPQGRRRVAARRAALAAPWAWPSSSAPRLQIPPQNLTQVRELVNVPIVRLISCFRFPWPAH
jgi:hypothetical protein